MTGGPGRDGGGKTGHVDEPRGRRAGPEPAAALEQGDTGQHRGWRGQWAGADACPQAHAHDQFRRENGTCRAGCAAVRTSTIAPWSSPTISGARAAPRSIRARRGWPIRLSASPARPGGRRARQEGDPRRRRAASAPSAGPRWPRSSATCSGTSRRSPPSSSSTSMRSRRGTSRSSSRASAARRAVGQRRRALRALSGPRQRSARSARPAGPARARARGRPRRCPRAGTSPTRSCSSARLPPSA